VQHDKIYFKVQDPALQFPKNCKPDLPNSHFSHISPASAVAELGPRLYDDPVLQGHSTNNYFSTDQRSNSRSCTATYVPSYI